MAFRIKICGVATPDDARLAAAAGADCLGLNFYPQSVRYLAPRRAEEVARAVPAGIMKAGVFVNAAAETVCETFDRLALDLIQLHGDEPPEFLRQIGTRPVMRAFRVGPEGFARVDEYLAECRRLGCLPKLVLIDAFCAGAYGGSGATGDWAAAAAWRAKNPDLPLVLAGGLTPANVAAAIAAVVPAAVDVASGVESSPGIKDAALMAAFVQAAAGAFESFP